MAKTVEKPAETLIAVQTKMTENEVAAIDEARRKYKAEDGKIPSRADLTRVALRELCDRLGVRMKR